jgi:hypothetical protein
MQFPKDLNFSIGANSANLVTLSAASADSIRLPFSEWKVKRRFQLADG